MPFNDDAVQMAELAGVTPFAIFENREIPYSLIFRQYRPLGYWPWILIGQAFGWFTPAALHRLNVWVYVLATAVVGAIRLRLAALFNLPELGSLL